MDFIQIHYIFPKEHMVIIFSNILVNCFVLDIVLYMYHLT